MRTTVYDYEYQRLIIRSGGEAIEATNRREERAMTMNYTRAVFLISDDVRAVACVYGAGEGAKRTVFKTFDREIRVDDFVVVPTDTRHRMTVVRVVEVDLEPDLQSGDDMEQIEAQEKAAIAKIKAAELRRQKRELRDALLDEEATKDLKLLPIGPPLHPEAPGKPKEEI